jgi:hypothetical protein
VAIPHVHTSAYRPVQAVLDWLVVAEITTGALLPRMYRSDTVGDSRLTDQSVALVIKRLALRAGRQWANSLWLTEESKSEPQWGLVGTNTAQPVRLRPVVAELTLAQAEETRPYPFRRPANRPHPPTGPAIGKRRDRVR